MGDIVEQSRRTYILNTPVLTSYGEWQFEGPLSLEAARDVVREGFISAVGHGGAAAFLGRLLGREVPASRVAVELLPGDRALVLRLKTRLPEGVALTNEEMESLPFELGLLKRLS